jgi:hypothetical protein
MSDHTVDPKMMAVCSGFLKFDVSLFVQFLSKLEIQDVWVSVLVS